jgi:hypothetical protein
MNEDEINVAGALRELAARSRPPKSLPTAGQIWWRAEVVRRLSGNTGEREVRPALWGEIAGIAAAVAVLLLFFTLEASPLLGLLAGRETAGGVLLKIAVGLLPAVAASLLGFLLIRET